mmetsp:Transcript_1364/g.1553  ORF Transcript_1364/g.1553 Transcript_1364/m.1553 type:complete len:102 (+) Transcript_1364:229-534(+)
MVHEKGTVLNPGAEWVRFGASDPTHTNQEQSRTLAENDIANKNKQTHTHTTTTTLVATLQYNQPSSSSTTSFDPLDRSVIGSERAPFFWDSVRSGGGSVDA